MRSFDQNADGTLISEGLGLFALKRLDDAIRDGDRIYAQVIGVGAASDGRHKSIYAPHQPGQVRALRAAYQDANVSPATLRLIEAHSPGTRVGDGIEVGALREVFEEAGADLGSVALGSVKSQIGHTKAAAGAAGMMKAVLALHERVLPPTAHVETPNPELGWEQSPFYLNTEARPWRSGESPRRAGVNALGFGGANYHVVLEEAPAGTPSASVFVPGLSISRAVGGNEAAPVIMFTGQGSQYPGMARELALCSPILRRALERFDQWFEEEGIEPLTERLYPPRAFDPATTRSQNERLRDTRYAQAGLAAVEMAQWSLLREANVRPACVLGHSFGEVMALWAAGVMSETDCLRLVFERGRLLAPAKGEEGGAMLSVGLGEEAVRDLLTAFPAIELANLNAHDQTVVGGSVEEIVALQERLESQNVSVVRLQVSAAFHTRYVAHARSGWEAAVRALELGKPEFPVIANETGLPYPGDPAAIAEQLTRHPFRPVRFYDSLKYLSEGGHRRFIEVGPKPVLGGLLRRSFEDRGCHALCCGGGPEGDLSAVASVLRACGGEVDRLQAVASSAFVDETSGVAAPPSPSAVRVSAAGFRPPERDEAYREALAALARPSDRQQEIGLGSRDSDSEADALSASAASAPLIAKELLHLESLKAHRDFLSLQASFLDALQSASVDSDTAAGIRETMNEVTRVHREYVEGQIEMMHDGGAPFAASGPSSGDPVDELTSAEILPATLAPDLQPTSAAEPESLPVEAPTASDAPSLRARLLEVVADKTGYPAEVIRPDMDLEADLGIDSIKRVEILAEVQAWLGAKTLDPAALTDRRSLAAIADYLTDLIEPDGNPGAARDPETHQGDAEAVSDSSAAERVAKGNGDLAALLASIVAEKTGYPAEVIRPEMDLEADLGIDSIKRVEIFAAVQEQLGLTLDPAGFADRRSLQRIAAGLSEVVSGSAGAPASAVPACSDAKARVEADAPEVSRPLPIWKEVWPSPDVSVPALGPSVLGRCLLVCDGGVLAAEMAAALEEAGLLEGIVCLTASTLDDVCFPRDVVSAEGSCEGLRHAWTREHARGPDVDSILVLCEDKNDRVDESRLAQLVTLCGLAKPQLASASLRGRPSLLMAAPARSASGRESLLAAGQCALARTLASEWEATRVGAVALMGEVRARELLAAWTDSHLATVVRLSTGEHQSSERQSSDWELIAEPLEAVEAIEAGVFLVSGGARGITAACTLALCDRMKGGRFLLIGRSVPEAVPRWAEEAAQAGKIKATVAQRLTEDGSVPTPREIEDACRRIEASREIAITLEAIREGGGEARYLSVDVADAEALREAVEPVLQAWGPATGIVHGAGVLADRAIERLGEADFQRVWKPKVHGLENLISLTSPKQLRHCLIFSSVAAAFGNAGQSLYAMANQALNARAESLRRENPMATVFALNWGPWQTGMVDEVLERRFRERGIRTISVADGTACFLRFATAVPDDSLPAVIAIGDRMDASERQWARSFAREFTAAERAIAEAHRVGGRPVLPAAWAMSWMIEAAEILFPQSRGLDLRDVRVLEGIFPDESTDRVGGYQVRLEDIRVEGATANCRAVIRSEGPGDVVRDHYRAELCFGVRDELPGKGLLNLGSRVGELPPCRDWEAYREGLIQYGESFGWVADLIELEEKRVVTRLKPSAAGRAFDPLIYDLATHGILIWLREHHQCACLPSVLGRYRQPAPLPTDEPLVVVLEIESFAPPSVAFSISVQGEKGRVYALAEGLRMTLTAQPETLRT